MKFVKVPIPDPELKLKSNAPGWATADNTQMQRTNEPVKFLNMSDATHLSEQDI